MGSGTLIARGAVVGGGALAVAGVARATRDDDTLFGKDRSFYAGLGAGIVGALALKAGIGRLPNLGVMEKVSRMPGGAVGRFAAATAISTVPSFVLLRATSGDRELLGQGHDFWAGAVWGLAGVATLKASVPLSKLKANGPLAAGWVAGDFVALGLDAALRSGNAAPEH